MEKKTFKKSSRGSSFDDYLEEEGFLERCTATAIKRVISYQLAEVMKEQHISKPEMAKRMKTSRAAVDRLFDPKNDSITLLTITKAAAVLGKDIKFELVTR